MSALLCPDCRIEMQPQRYYGVTVDVCPACAGVWFDEAEIRMLKQVDPLVLLTIEERAYPDVKYNPEETVNRRCPRCAILLRPFFYLYDSPVELDRCEQCHGIWIEDGELHKMHEALIAQQSPSELERQRLAVARYEMEHQERVERANLITSLFSLLRRRVPPFSGF
ncbi:MAG: zf-TFIIB domain-containing protein [Armatimonadota bacterium]|nr:zf-TFIIB domain-containing protein [bacterium]MDW8320272.1 zf-TFIIB domain-containing protein [Armatimonadota bacterium]